MTLRSLLVLALLLFGSPLARPLLAVQTDEPSTEQEFRANLERRVGRHPYFKQIELEWVWEYEDFVVLVQPPSKADPDHVAKVAKLKSADSQVMNLAFRDGLAKAYGLQLRPTSPRMTIVVLATRGDFKNYFSMIKGGDPGGYTFVYKPSERMFVTCMTPFSQPTDPSGARRQYERETRADQIVHAYSARSEAQPDPYWLELALAHELAGYNDLESTTRGIGRESEWSLHRLCETITDRTRRRTLLQPLKALLDQTDFRGVYSTHAALAEGAKVKASTSGDEVYQAYTAHAGALFHYLSFEADADLRARMQRFASAAMKMQLQILPFDKVFKGVDWVEVEREFWTYVWQRHARLAPKEELDGEALAAFLAERSSSNAGGLQPAIADSTSDSRSLLAYFDAPDARLALALASLRGGDAGAARALLVEALEAAPEDERLQRELVRTEAWIAERLRYLQFLIDDGKKLVIDHDGKRLLAEVAEIDAGVVVFRSSNRDLESLPLNALDAVSLAKRMQERRSDFDASWAAAYPLVVAADASASRSLKGDEPERVALAADAEADYPARADTIEAAFRARELAFLTESEKAGSDHLDLISADSTLEHVSALWALRERVPVVTTLRPKLIGAASLALAARFAELELNELLAGHVEERRDGTLFLRYDFSDPAQLEDWPLDDETRSFEDSEPRVTTPKRLLVRNGKLQGEGEISRTHVLGFEGPQTMSWQEIAHQGTGVTDEKVLHYRFALCKVPGKLSELATVNSLQLCAKDEDAREYLFRDPKKNNTRFDTTYENSLVFDGTGNFALLRDGEEQLSVPAGSRLTGHPHIWLQSDYTIEIEALELTGKITAASLARLRQRWTAAELAKLRL